MQNLKKLILDSRILDIQENKEALLNANLELEEIEITLLTDYLDERPTIS